MYSKDVSLALKRVFVDVFGAEMLRSFAKV